MPHILIVEDEVHLAQGLLFNLEAEGHEAVAVESGEMALDRLLKDGESFDAIVLDVMLPGINGFEVATKLREAQNYTPILMLTARARPEDVLKGFASGADDYLPKPFDLAILLARVNGLLRRSDWASRHKETTTPPGPEVFNFHGRTLDFSTLELTSPAGKTQLTLMEASLLRYFLEHPNRNVSRKQILEEVWGLHEDTDTRAIDNFIVRLRRYIEDSPGTPALLVTVRGIGYRFLGE
jgi:DNA-binding response OmpR family regulator